MDLTKLSTEDLQALQSGDLSKVSTAGLQSLQGAPPTSKLDQVIGKPSDFVEGLKNFAGKNLVAGAVRGAADIGQTILRPFQAALDPPGAAQATNAGIEGGLDELGADKNSLAYKTARPLAQIAGTAGVGGALGKTAQALGAAPRLVNALASSGFATGQAPASLAGRMGDMALRMAGGGATNAAAMGLVDPSQAGTAGAIGGALPPSLKAVGSVAVPAGKALANSLVGPVSGEVANLAQVAKNKWGIDIPIDRIANSKPLNALASSLNYVPLSGRAGVENRMSDQMNRALSTTFGQDSPNVTMALRKAEGDLGSKFESTLKNNTVKIDPQFLSDLADSANKATKELAPDQAKIISNQIDDIVSKGANGEIDGQTAYNIKKTLDRIGDRNSTEAFYARDLKRSLMGALDRSLGPQEAQAFAQTRKQYGNMLDLQGLAQNGAEGGISIGRLANMKNINNPDLQELADISAQFLKSRESNHGAAQRAFLGGGGLLGAHAFGVPGYAALGAGMAAGRGANALLDSSAMRNTMLGKGAPITPEELNLLAGSGSRALSRAGSQN